MHNILRDPLKGRRVGKAGRLAGSTGCCGYCADDLWMIRDHKKTRQTAEGLPDLASFYPIE